MIRFKKNIKNVTRYTLHATRSSGFTLLELLVSVSILGIIVGFSSWAYLNIQKNSDLSNQTSLLVNTIRQAQTYAVSGQTGLSLQEHGLKRIITLIRTDNTICSNLCNYPFLSVSRAYAVIMGDPPPTNEQLDMGIHFETDNYTLFYGSVYNFEDSRNTITNLPSTITLSLDLPTSDLVFTARSGEVSNFDANHHIITISHSDGQSHVLSVNQLGVVDVD